MTQSRGNAVTRDAICTWVARLRPSDRGAIAVITCAITPTLIRNAARRWRWLTVRSARADALFRRVLVRGMAEALGAFWRWNAHLERESIARRRAWRVLRSNVARAWVAWTGLLERLKPARRAITWWTHRAVHRALATICEVTQEYAHAWVIGRRAVLFWARRREAGAFRTLRGVFETREARLWLMRRGAVSARFALKTQSRRVTGHGRGTKETSLSWTTCSLIGTEGRAAPCASRTPPYCLA